MTKSRNAINVGVVGAGKRAASYFTNIPEDLRLAVRLTGLVDPSKDNRAAFISLFGAGASVGEYASAAEMFERAELDAVILAPPNLYHADVAELALARGIHVLLEKPVAISVEECRRLWLASQSAPASATVAVGFVLRYTPFYSRVKEIVASGELGSILAIDADENLGTNLTNLFHKGWRREDALSGGFMVEKCCHDLDILNWLMEAHVDRVFSMSRRTHFVHEPAGGRQSRFDARDLRQADDVDFGSRDINEAFFTPSPGSPYDFPSDSPDHQAVMLHFAENGALANFMACMGQPRTNRGIRIFGSDGSLEGNLDDNRIIVHKPHASGNGWHTSTHTVEAETGNHHGGDSVISEAFWRTAANQESAVKAGLREGIEAVIVALAAQQSAATLAQVDVTTLRDRVFGPHNQR